MQHRTTHLVPAVVLSALSLFVAEQAHAAYTFTTINVPGVTGGTYAQGINDAGLVTGYYYDNTGGHGFVDTASVFTSINAAGAAHTYAQGINDAGQVTGYYSDNTGNHGFVATPVVTSVEMVPEPASLAMLGLGVDGPEPRPAPSCHPLSHAIPS